MTSINRRKFLAGTAGLSSLFILRPSIAFGSAVNSSIRVGIIGCGNRGTEVLSAMVRSTGAVVHAMADLFDYQLTRAKPKFDKLNSDKGLPVIDQTKVFSGSKAFVQLLELKDIDAVLISSPAYTHAHFLESAVLSGKHVYCEKPVSPDVNGCKKVLAIGEKIDGNLSIAIGFQIRHASPYVEMANRIRNGDIGEIINVQLYYIGSRLPFVQPVGNSAEEFMIRNHFHFTELSGGILLDQAIHMIDICNWITDFKPESATGTGNRKGEPDFGDTYTNYQIIYGYPDKINVSLHSTQFSPKFGDVCARFIGTKGIAEAHYNRGVFIEGDNKWDSGVLRGLEPTSEQRVAGVLTSALQNANEDKVKAFIKSIETGQYINEARSGVDSTLSAILGRMSAVDKRETNWDEMYDSNQHYELNLNLSQFDK